MTQPFPRQRGVGTSPAAATELGEGVRLSFVLVTTMAAGPVVQYAIASLGPLITTELHISPVQFGLLPAVFAASAALASPATGAVLRRLGSRSVARWLMILAAVALLLAAAAPGYLWLMPAVVLAGISMGGSNPTTNDLVTRSATGPRRGLLVGVKQSGVNGGILVAGSLLPLLAVDWGWRPALASAVVWPALGVLWLGRTRVADVADRPGAASRAAASQPVRHLVSWLALYSLLMGGAAAAAGMYLPLFAFDVLEMSASAAGLTTGVLGLVGMASRLIWAHRSQRYTDIVHLLIFFSAGAAVTSLAMTRIDLLGSRGLFVGTAVFAMFSSSWLAVMMVAIVQHIPASSSAWVTGAVMMGFYVGFMIGPPLFGVLATSTVGYAGAWSGSALACALATILAVRGRGAFLRVPPEPMV
jgi:predicted MFS family arabinose efflux permease